MWPRRPRDGPTRMERPSPPAPPRGQSRNYRQWASVLEAAAPSGINCSVGGGNGSEGRPRRRGVSHISGRRRPIGGSTCMDATYGCVRHGLIDIGANSGGGNTRFVCHRQRSFVRDGKYVDGSVLRDGRRGARYHGGSGGGNRGGRNSGGGGEGICGGTDGSRTHLGGDGHCPSVRRGLGRGSSAPSLRKGIGYAGVFGRCGLRNRVGAI